jgi:hypothetical protein
VIPAASTAGWRIRPSVTETALTMSAAAAQRNRVRGDITFSFS